jgi:hypothetical protein
MRKIILPLFVFCFTSAISQTLSYTATAEYDYYNCNIGQGYNCSNGLVSYIFSGAIGQDQTPNSSNQIIKKVYANIPLASSYTFSSTGGYCLKNTGGSVQVLPSPSSATQTIGNLIQSSAGANLLLSGCFGASYFSAFTPNNMTIKNMKSTNEICAGENLDLIALPSGYPSEAYNWQYSIDNQTTWVNVPQKLINGISTNRTTNSNFSIYDILGTDHVNHFGNIYFRIGYSGRPFSNNIIKINYTPCAPLVTKIDYKGPNCIGDDIQKLDVYFDRPLDVSKSEKLYQIYVRETINNTGIIKTTPLMLVSDVTYSNSSNVYSYSNFSNFSSLENGREYEIIYQAQIRHPIDTNPNIKILKGFLVGADYPFKYKEPNPINFTIKKADNPKCNNDQVEVVIDAQGGTGDYQFYVDDIEQKTPKLVKETDGYFHIKGLSPTAINNIKVTDTNGCIEK